MLDLAGIGMAVIVGVRREDKNEWERRVPLIPSHLARLQRDHDLEFLVQPSPIRIFKDDEYTAAGATVTEDLFESMFGKANVQNYMRDQANPWVRGGNDALKGAQLAGLVAGGGEKTPA